MPILASALLAMACNTQQSPKSTISVRASSLPAASSSPSEDPTTDSVAVRFRALDGVRLAGRLFGRRSVAVVLAHQIDDDQTDWFDFAAELRSRGYEALTFNFRGVCSSTPISACSKGVIDPNESWSDVVGAVRFVRSRGAKSVVLIGASLGGEAVIVAASKLGTDVQGVVSLSASEGLVGLLDLDVAHRTVAAIRAPKLFMAGKGDRGFADAARDYFAHARDPKELRLVPVSEHGVGLLQSSEGDTVKNLIFGFIAENASLGP